MAGVIADKASADAFAALSSPLRCPLGYCVVSWGRFSTSFVLGFTVCGLPVGSINSSSLSHDSPVRGDPRIRLRSGIVLRHLQWAPSTVNEALCGVGHTV